MTQITAMIIIERVQSNRLDICDIMKCNVCKQIYDGNFCPFCGTKKEELKEELKEEIYPQFNFWYSLIIDFVFVFLFITFFALVIFEKFSLIIVTIIPLIFALIINYIKSSIYKNIYYKFYFTKLEYCNPFLGIKNQIIDYKYIDQISFKQSEIDKIFNIGKIIIRTRNYYISPTVFMNYIKNPKDVYEKIKKITENGDLK